MKSHVFFRPKVAVGYLLIFFLSIMFNVMAQQQKLEQVNPKNSAATPKKLAIGSQTKQAVNQTGKSKPNANAVKAVPAKNKTFIPSEHISEDLSVSFPIDI